MVRDTRQTILNTAKKMFSERGYNDVSTGDISDAIGISKGNLTYYFKKKEDIIEAILMETPSSRLISAPKNISELNIFFRDMQSVIKEYGFYFWHHTQFSQLSPKIYEMQNDTLKKNIEFLKFSFNQFVLDGILNSKYSSSDYDRLIDTLLITSIYWLPFSRLKEESSSFDFLQQAWNIMLPYLTDIGKDELNKVL